jgi:hypothetical protein
MENVPQDLLSDQVCSRLALLCMSIRMLEAAFTLHLIILVVFLNLFVDVPLILHRITALFLFLLA